MANIPGELPGYPLPVPATKPRSQPTIWFQRLSDNEVFGVRVYADNGQGYTAEFKKLHRMASTGEAILVDAPPAAAPAPKPEPTLVALPTNRTTRATRALTQA